MKSGGQELRPFWVADGAFFTSDAPVSLACVLSAMVRAQLRVGLTLLRWPFSSFSVDSGSDEQETQRKAYRACSAPAAP